MMAYAVIPAFRRLRQKDFKFEASQPGLHRETLSQKQKNKKQKNPQKSHIS
jgi:hypothetical protein